MMACHLNNEEHALKIIKLLCTHKISENQSREVDFNAYDLALNTCIHHASHTNKLDLVKYMVEEHKVNLNVRNEKGQLPIDMTTNSLMESYLEQF